MTVGQLTTATPFAARARQLERGVTRWFATAAAPHEAEISLLRGEIADFCRALHAVGVHGPTVRRLAADAVESALGDRVDGDVRLRMARGAQCLVDVIYLTGEHREPSDGVGEAREKGA